MLSRPIRARGLKLLILQRLVEHAQRRAPYGRVD